MHSDKSSDQQMTLFDADMEQSFDKKTEPLPFLDYTSTSKRGQRIHSCMQTIKPFCEKQPVITVGEMQIKIPRREIDLFSNWLIKRFNEGFSFKESMIEVIRHCDTQL